MPEWRLRFRVSILKLIKNCQPNNVLNYHLEKSYPQAFLFQYLILHSLSSLIRVYFGNFLRVTNKTDNISSINSQNNHFWGCHNGRLTNSIFYDFRKFSTSKILPRAPDLIIETIPGLVKANSPKKSPFLSVPTCFFCLFASSFNTYNQIYKIENCFGNILPDKLLEE